jgi:RNA polymerase sigma-70 factor, ECF subfamily
VPRQQGGWVDRELVTRARDGDHDAFARIAAGSIGRLNAIARLILHDHAAAEDAVQDALVEGWRNLRALRDPDRFDPWLNRILVRSCQDARRRASRRGGREVAWAGGAPVSTDAADGSLADADQLERGLRRLTTEQRTVIVLTYYLDLPQAEAAAALGIPVGTLKSRLNRSLDALRAAIDADERRPSQPVRQPT